MSERDGIGYGMMLSLLLCCNPFPRMCNARAHLPLTPLKAFASIRFRGQILSQMITRVFCIIA